MFITSPEPKYLKPWRRKRTTALRKKNPSPSINHLKDRPIKTKRAQSPWIQPPSPPCCLLIADAKIKIARPDQSETIEWGENEWTRHACVCVCKSCHFETGDLKRAPENTRSGTGWNLFPLKCGLIDGRTHWRTVFDDRYSNRDVVEAAPRPPEWIQAGAAAPGRVNTFDPVLVSVFVAKLCRFFRRTRMAVVSGDGRLIFQCVHPAPDWPVEFQKQLDSQIASDTMASTTIDGSTSLWSSTSSGVRLNQAGVEIYARQKLSAKTELK